MAPCSRNMLWWNKCNMYTQRIGCEKGIKCLLYFIDTGCTRQLLRLIISVYAETFQVKWNGGDVRHCRCGFCLVHSMSEGNSPVSSALLCNLALLWREKKLECSKSRQYFNVCKQIALVIIGISSLLCSLNIRLRFNYLATSKSNTNTCTLYVLPSCLWIRNPNLSVLSGSLGTWWHFLRLWIEALAPGCGG
jgi:hypothetical protein